MQAWSARRRFSCFVAIAILAALSGCGESEPEPDKTLRQTIEAANKLADALQTVRDQQSAEANLDLVKQRMSEMQDALKRLGNTVRGHSYQLARGPTANELRPQVRSSVSRFEDEMGRLHHTPGLSVAFWKSANAEFLEVLALWLGSGFLEDAPTLQGFTNNVQKLYRECAFEEVVEVEFSNVNTVYQNALFGRLIELAPGAKAYFMRVGTALVTVVGPVKDFQAFVREIDLGAITYKDESRRGLVVEFSSDKLMSRRANRLPFPVQNFNPNRRSDLRPNVNSDLDSEQPTQRIKAMEESLAAARAKAAAMRRAEQGPDPNDPHYYDEMAVRMLSDNVFESDRAIDAMLRADPAAVALPEAKKKIARAFKAMAESDNPFHRKKAIAGLVKWGGNYSVPILLKMLSNQHSLEETDVLNALVELKDPRGAPALVARLEDLRCGRIAYDGLVALGSGAEEAILTVVESNNTAVCIDAIRLLGEVGTDKCTALLNRAKESRNRPVRLEAMKAAQKINKRRLEAKAKAKVEAGEE
jgi:HEAT repeat protein